jgi:hypothetical protein
MQIVIYCDCSQINSLNPQYFFIGEIGTSNNSKAGYIAGVSHCHRHLKCNFKLISCFSLSLQTANKGTF